MRALSVKRSNTYSLSRLLGPYALTSAHCSEPFGGHRMTQEGALPIRYDCLLVAVEPLRKPPEMYASKRFARS
jgi:hypothetical protein